MKILRDWFTERDNATWCIVRMLLTSGGIAMIYKFILAGSPDFQAFGLGLAGIGAAIAAKNASEKT